MGRFFAPAVRVTNNFSRDIKVKVDPSRCVFKLVKDEDYETQRTSTGLCQFLQKRKYL